MRTRSLFSSLVVATVVVAGSTASATSPPDDDPTMRWAPERGWVPLVEQPPSAPQERWAADFQADAFWRGIVLDAATYVVLEAEGDDLLVTGTDLTTGEELWSAPLDLTDDNTDDLLLGTVSEIGEGAIFVMAYREYDRDEAGATDPPGSESASGDPTHDKFVIDVTNGAVLWQGVEGEDCCINLAVTPDLVIVDGTALDRATGEWAWQAEGWFTASGSTVMVASEFGADEPGFGVVDPADGHLAWWQPADDDGRVNRRMYLADDTVLHARDGDDAVIEGYDRLTGTRRWTMPSSELPGDLDSLLIDVRAMGDGLALIRDPEVGIDGDDGFRDGGAAVVDLRTGHILWEVDGATEIGPAFDNDGEPIVIRRDADGYRVLDGRAGEIRATLPCEQVSPPAREQFQPVAGGVICVTPRFDSSRLVSTTITMWTFDGIEVWTVDLTDGPFFNVIPGGFVASRVVAGRTEMVGFTG